MREGDPVGNGRMIGKLGKEENVKKIVAVLLCTLGLLGILALCPPPPEEPVCGEGQITVTPAVWVDGYEVPGHYEAREYIEPVYSYSCPVVSWSYYGHNVQVPYEKSSDPTKCHRPSDADLKNVYGMGNTERGWFKFFHSEWKDAIKTEVTPGYFTEWEEVEYCKTKGHKDTCRYIEGTYVPGYWTDPVCRDPLLTAEVTSTCDGVFLQTFTEGLPDGDPVLLFAWVDPYAIETFLYNEATYEEPTECLEYRKTCEVQGKIWYECNSGTWTYTGTSANKCWCGGLTGNRVVKESYDCGQTWYWYYNGEPIEPMNFGMYPAPACY